MLIAAGPGLWIADGSETVAVLGFRYPLRMAVIRLDRGLFVWSPVQLTNALRAEVAALGDVTHIVAPNSLHHLFLGEWSEAWPEAAVWAAPGLARKRPDMSFAGELCDTPETAWGDDIDQVVVRGCAITSEVVFFHRPSGTVLFTDLLQQMPKGWFRGWRAWVAKLDLMVGPEPQVPRKFRLAFTDRKAARVSVGRILNWPAQKVVMAHGTPVEDDAEAFLASAFSWLM